MKNIENKISSRIRELRKKHNLTQEQTADLGNIYIDSYKKIESNKTYPSIFFLENLYKSGWDIDYIITGREKNENLLLEPFKNAAESRYFNIYNILVHKIHSELPDKTDSKPYEPILIEETEELTPDKRVLHLLIAELGYENFSSAAVANALGVSLRTAQRWLKGEATLNTKMLQHFCMSCHHSPSYVLFGEINSNSQYYRYYKDLTAEQQVELKQLYDKLDKLL